MQDARITGIHATVHEQAVTRERDPLIEELGAPRHALRAAVDRQRFRPPPHGVQPCGERRHLERRVRDVEERGDAELLVGLHDTSEVVFAWHSDVADPVDGAVRTGRRALGAGASLGQVDECVLHRRGTGVLVAVHLAVTTPHTLPVVAREERQVGNDEAIEWIDGALTCHHLRLEYAALVAPHRREVGLRGDIGNRELLDTAVGHLAVKPTHSVRAVAREHRVDDLSGKTQKLRRTEDRRVVTRHHVARAELFGFASQLDPTVDAGCHEAKPHDITRTHKAFKIRKALIELIPEDDLPALLFGHGADGEDAEMWPDLVLIVEAGLLLHVDEHRTPLEAGLDTEDHRRLRDVLIGLAPPVTTNSDLRTLLDRYMFGEGVFPLTFVRVHRAEDVLVLRIFIHPDMRFFVIVDVLRVTPQHPHRLVLEVLDFHVEHGDEHHQDEDDFVEHGVIREEGYRWERADEKNIRKITNCLVATLEVAKK